MNQEAFINCAKERAKSVVVASLQQATRALWAEGLFDGEEQPNGDLWLRASLVHIKHDHVKVKAAMFTRDKRTRQAARRAGGKLGTLLVKEIVSYINRKEKEERDYDNESNFKTPPKKFGGKSPPKAPPRKKPKRPATCEICGPEDKDKFPDWGPCPHRSKT